MDDPVEDEDVDGSTSESESDEPLTPQERIEELKSELEDPWDDEDDDGDVPSLIKR